MSSTSAVTYTCFLCRVSLGSSETQKLHFKSEWHLQNLKLQGQGLPPVTFEEFIECLASTSPSTDPETKLTRRGARYLLKKQNRGIEPAEKLVELGKSRPSKEKKTDHLKKRAPPVVAGKGEIKNAGAVRCCYPGGKRDQVKRIVHEDGKVDYVRQEKYQATFCLFDDYVFESVEQNVEHMISAHGMRIPDRRYCNDLQGLVEYLGRKVYEGHICLYCDSAFRSVLAVRHHMFAVGHCHVGTHLEDQVSELLPFYDYSNSFMELWVNGEQVGDMVANRLSISCPVENEDDWEYVDDDEMSDNETYVKVRGDIPGEVAHHHPSIIEQYYEKLGLKKSALTPTGNLTLPTGKEIRNRRNVQMCTRLSRIGSSSNRRTTAINATPLSLAITTRLLQLQMLQKQSHNNEVDFYLKNKFVTIALADGYMKAGIKNNKLQSRKRRQNVIFG